jgi:hypothetical protein
VYLIVPSAVLNEFAMTVIGVLLSYRNKKRQGLEMFNFTITKDSVFGQVATIEGFHVVVIEGIHHITKESYL